MSYFNSQPAFVHAQEPRVPTENQDPKQWSFPQVQTPPLNVGTIGGQSSQVNQGNQVKSNRKRSCSNDDPCHSQVFVRSHFDAPSKRRKGLSDATVAMVNSSATPNYWGKLSC